MNKPKSESIKILRLSYGLTQSQAAESVGVTLNTWQKWESGSVPVNNSAWEQFKWKNQSIITWHQALSNIDPQNITVTQNFKKEGYLCVYYQNKNFDLATAIEINVREMKIQDAINQVEKEIKLFNQKWAE